LSVVRCPLSATTLTKLAFLYLASSICVIRVVNSFSMLVVKSGRHLLHATRYTTVFLHWYCCFIPRHSVVIEVDNKS
jgi:hypothetical protein